MKILHPALILLYFEYKQPFLSQFNAITDMETLMPKKIWTNILNRVAENVTSKVAMESTTWQKLFDCSDTFYKCHEGYYWAMQSNNTEFATQFYQQMIKFMQTFEQKKKLARIAQEKEEQTILNYCLSGMIEGFLPFRDFPGGLKTLIRRGKAILRILPSDDSRKSRIETHLTSLQSSS